MKVLLFQNLITVISTLFAVIFGYIGYTLYNNPNQCGKESCKVNEPDEPDELISEAKDILEALGSKKDILKYLSFVLGVFMLLNALFPIFVLVKKITIVGTLFLIAIGIAMAMEVYYIVDIMTEIAEVKKKCPKVDCNQILPFENDTEKILGLSTTLLVIFAISGFVLVSSG
jgi:hypothetical protein